jgi:hypothetical protein
MVPAWSRPEPARRRVTHRASRRPRRTASAHRRQPRTRSSRGLRVVLDAALDLAGRIRSCWPAGGWCGLMLAHTRPRHGHRRGRASPDHQAGPRRHRAGRRRRRTPPGPGTQGCSILSPGSKRQDGEPTVCLLANRWLRHQHFMLTLQSSRMRPGQGSRRRPDLVRLPGRPPRPPSPHPRRPDSTEELPRRPLRGASRLGGATLTHGI